MRLLHPVGVRNDKNREQELCGKCVRDGSGLAIRTRGIFPFFGFLGARLNGRVPRRDLIAKIVAARDNAGSPAPREARGTPR